MTELSWLTFISTRVIGETTIWFDRQNLNERFSNLGFPSLCQVRSLY